MYQSLRRAALAAIVLSAAAWALLLAVGRELVEVPVARAAPVVTIAEPVSIQRLPARGYSKTSQPVVRSRRSRSTRS